jgi:hypothetical protein
MSLRIVVEALLLVSWWGLSERPGRGARLAGITPLPNTSIER